MTYREMKDARDAAVAARNEKDAERMRGMYRPAGSDGRALCVADRRFTFPPMVGRTARRGVTVYRSAEKQALKEDRKLRRWARREAARQSRIENGGRP